MILMALHTLLDSSTISCITVTAVKCLITSCQVKGVFIFMSWGCAVWGKWWYNPLFIERTMTDNLPEDVWKVKITSFSLNNAVLSNIYRTERKQGHRCLLIDFKTGQGCHRIWVWETAREKQENQALCLEEVLIAELPRALFKKRNRLGFLLVVSVCLCMWQKL